jgi:hypothetical protein
MPKKTAHKNMLSLLHSDKLILQILNETNEYLQQHPETGERIEEDNWIFRSLFQLLPETLETFWSGHIFPIAEAEYELECSIVLCKLGFYKHAISSLRNVLELGLLSVYWDIDDQSHIDIQNWLRSMESTPFRKRVFTKLKRNSNIRTFDDKQNLFEKTSALYGELSDFSHTKGFGYSSRQLNKHQSNVNSFNEMSLTKWLELTQRVVEIISIFHVLKYPVGLQYTPIEEKFGLNGPMGGFIEPHQVERIKEIISKEMLADLQEISDNDPDVIEVIKWINDQPDITETEFRAQIERQDKQFIEMQGYDLWIRNERKLYKSIQKNNPKLFEEKKIYFKKLKLWAKENGHLTKHKLAKISALHIS